MFERIVYAVFGLVIGLIVAFLKGLYDRLNKEPPEITAHFVMSESTCCNKYENPAKTPQCRNYCTGLLMEKFRVWLTLANKSICIAMFNFNSKQLANFILSAHKHRNVHVRIIVNKSTCENDNRQVRRLQELGIAVQECGDEMIFMHHKFCLIDGASDIGGLITGSLNWTHTALSKHYENVVFIKNQHLQQKYQDAFDTMWNKYSNKIQEDA